MSVRISENEVRMIHNVSNSLYRHFKDISGLDVNENNVILYFLTLKKQGFSSDLLSDSNSTENQINKFIYSLNPDYKKSYSEIINFYAPIIKKIDKRDLIYMFDRWSSLCNSIEPGFLNKYFLEIFDTILSIHSVFEESSLIPTELSRLMSNIVPLKKGDTIFNPNAGEAAVGVFTSSENVYCGQESNLTRYIIGKLRLLSCPNLHNKNLIFTSTVNEWNSYKIKFDLVVTDMFSIPNNISPNNKLLKKDNLLKLIGAGIALPVIPVIGMIAAGFVGYELSKKIDQNLDDVITKSLHELKEGGKLVVLIPDNFLHKEDTKLRESLINNDSLESVISLPSGILKTTGVKTSILVISKSKVNKGIVNFINGTCFGSGSPTTNRKLDDFALIDVIRQNQENFIFRKVTTNLIKKSNYILDFNRYFLESFEGEPLGKFVSIKKGLEAPLNNIRTQEDSRGVLINSKDLKEDKVDFNLVADSLETTFIGSDFIQLEESALLIDLYNKTLKPTYFNYTGTPVYLGNGIIPLLVDSSKIVIDYLINELLSDVVKHQVNALSIGSEKQRLRYDDFMKIKINVPNLELQQLIVTKLKYSISQEKEKVLSLEKQLVDLKMLNSEELGVKQHSMRQHLANITNAMYVITTMMDKSNGILKANDVVSPTRGTLVSDIFERMNTSLEALGIEVKNLPNDGAFELATPVDLQRLVEESLIDYDNIKSSNVHIDYRFDIIQFQVENIDNISVMCSEKSIRELLNNVFENAEIHGFRNQEKDYTILVALFIENGKVVFQILNNGLPFPKGLKDKLGIKGEKAGVTGNTGIGVWRIIEIAKNYNFDYKIIDEPESDFPVGWEFKFNLIR